MKFKIKCPKNPKHALYLNGPHIYCDDCEDYLENDFLDKIITICINEGKEKGKREVRSVLGI